MELKNVSGDVIGRGAEHVALAEFSNADYSEAASYASHFNLNMPLLQIVPV